MPPILFLVSVVGDGLWIPSFFYFYRKSARALDV